MSYEKGHLDVAQNLFPAAHWNVPRQLFSLSNIKFKIYCGKKKVEKLEDFDSQITLAYEARDQYENRMTEIFPRYVRNNVSYNRRRAVTLGNDESTSDGVGTLALCLFIAIWKLEYKKIEQLVKRGRNKGLLNVKDKEGNTFLHLVADVIRERRYNGNIPDIDESAPLIQDIFDGLKEKYPQEDSRSLSLVAVACFLIDKGCDWLATNKENRTAADEILYWMESTAITDIFSKVCHRHFMRSIPMQATDSQMKLLFTVAGNGKDYGLDAQGRTSLTHYNDVFNSALDSFKQREPFGGSSVTCRINKPIEYHRSNNAHDGSAAAIIKQENCMPSIGTNDGNITGSPSLLTEFTQAMKDSSRSCRIPNLTNDMQLEVIRILKSQDDATINTIGGLDKSYSEQVLGRNIKTLNDKEWLDSAVMNAYAFLVQKRYENNPTTSFVSVGVISSDFIQALDALSWKESDLTQTNFENLFKWFDRNPMFLDTELVLVPFNIGGSHWVAASISIRNRFIKFFDSLKSSNNISRLTSYAEKIHSVLFIYGKSKSRDLKVYREWEIVYEKNIPQQENGYDCGVYALQFIECLSRGARFEFQQRDISKMRKIMIYELSIGELLPRPSITAGEQRIIQKQRQLGSTQENELSAAYYNYGYLNSQIAEVSSRSSSLSPSLRDVKLASPINILLPEGILRSIKEDIVKSPPYYIPYEYRASEVSCIPPNRKNTLDSTGTAQHHGSLRAIQANKRRPLAIEDHSNSNQAAAVRAADPDPTGTNNATTLLSESPTLLHNPVIQQMMVTQVAARTSSSTPDGDISSNVGQSGNEAQEDAVTAAYGENVRRAMTTTGISLSDANTLSAATESCMKQQDAAEALGLSPSFGDCSTSAVEVDPSLNHVGTVDVLIGSQQQQQSPSTSFNDHSTGPIQWSPNAFLAALDHACSNVPLSNGVAPGSIMVRAMEKAQSVPNSDDGSANPGLLPPDAEAARSTPGILSTIAEDDIAETPDAAAGTALTPPPTKRRRMASDRQSQSATTYWNHASNFDLNQQQHRIPPILVFNEALSLQLGMPVNETFPSDVIALGDAGTESCMDQLGVREKAPPAMNVDQADAAASNVSALPRNKKTRRGKTLASQPTAQEAAKKRQVPKPNGKLGESPSGTCTTASPVIEVREADLADVSVPSPSNRCDSPPNPEEAVIPNNPSGWWFSFGRIASKDDKREKPVHLKNAIGGSYSRGDKDSSWRDSSKSGCKAKVVYNSTKAEYELFIPTGHSCAKCRLPAERQGKPLPPIPQCIQRFLNMSKELFPPQNLRDAIRRQEEADESQKKIQTKASRKRK